MLYAYLQLRLNRSLIKSCEKRSDWLTNTGVTNDYFFSCADGTIGREFKQKMSIQVFE